MKSSAPAIAFVSLLESHTWGASEELWSQTALALRKMGVDVSACVKSWRQEDPHIRELEKAGCHVHRRRERFEGAGIFGKIARRVARKLDPTLGQYHWLDSIGDALIVISQGNVMHCGQWGEECIRRGKRYAIVSHGASDTCWLADPDVDRLREAYGHAAAKFFVSRGTAAQTSRLLAMPMDDARIVRSPVGVPYDVSLPWPDETHGMSLACVGRFAPDHKGQDLIFEVLRKEKWRSRPISVTLYGAGPSEKLFRRAVEMYRLNNVTIAGFVDGVQSIWARHHALLLPSRAEGMPLTVIEAMLCGRPCIVTDVAGNTEVVTDGITGFVAAAPTVDLLDQTMERAWEKRDLWRQMGEMSRRQIRELVPANPAQVFANELIELASAGSSASRPALASA